MARNTEATVTETPFDGTVPAVEKVRKPRTPSAPKPVFAVVVVKDSEGNVLNLTKAQVEVISFEKSAEKVLETIDSGAHPGAIYLRGMLPAGR